MLAHTRENKNSEKKCMKNWEKFHLSFVIGLFTTQFNFPFRLMQSNNNEKKGKKINSILIYGI